jgi:uncharacterized repeat protein (TIGR03803 family)
LAALCLGGVGAHAQTATPAVSTIVALSYSNPTGNIVRGADGALYGAASPATVAAAGLIYRTTLDGSSVTTVYQMPGQDLNSPLAGLLLASDGRLYGSTKFGRSTDTNGTGTIYSVALDGTGFTVIHRFDTFTTSNQELSPKNVEGAYPEAELIEGSDGYLYGMARAGGANGTGTIFKLTRDGTNFTVLHQFDAITSTVASGLTVTTDGAAPVGPLLQAADGLFYGTTSTGGANGRGTIFRVAFDAVAATGTGFQLLHTFSATTADATSGLLKNADGAAPVAGLTDGNDGFLYGVTTIGGSVGAGVVFALPLVGGPPTVLHNFDVNNGSRPAAELLLGTDGKLYGTTTGGGQTSTGTASSFGTIFTIDRAGTGFTRLYSFDSTEGTGPISKLIEISTGTLVGATSSAGSCGYGTVYQYSAAGTEVTGNTKCGRKKGDNNAYGGGAVAPALLLLLGGLGWMRRRRH